MPLPDGAPAPVRVIRLLRRAAGASRLAILLLLVASTLAVVLEEVYRLDLRRRERATVQDRTDGLAIALSVALSHRMALLNGLRAFLEVNWDRPGLRSDFDAYASRLHGSIAGIRTIQWVQDGVIRQTWPMAGNERAAGYDLRTDPRAFIREDYLRAERGNGIIISGPTDLVQGGYGLIARTPVRAADGRLLAVAAVVLDLAPLLAEAGLGADTTLRVTLQTADGAVFHGDASILDQHPERRQVALPEGTWHLSVAPVAGWGSVGRQSLLVVRVILGLLVALSALVTWLAGSRAQARARAAEERERRIGEEKFSRLFALSPDAALLMRRRDRVLLEVNDGAVALLGYPRAELVGSTLSDEIFHVVSGDWQEALRSMEARGVVRSFPLRFQTRAGEVREGLYSGRSIEVDGEPCLLSLVRDVTDQRLLEAQLAHAQKLEAVGRLAGGVAHDFNNLITAITGYAEMVRAGLPPGDPGRHDAEEILKASARAAGLTQQLLAFGRRQLVQPRLVDLNRLVSDLVSLLRRLMGASIEVSLELASEAAVVHIDPGQFEQVLANLAVNARDAMPEGGRLEIWVRVSGPDVVVEVEDTGDGMTPEVLAKAFDPFFTTKPLGKGSGLGLATTYGIIQQAGGTIAVRSAPGAGTRFTITLPSAEGTPEAPEDAPPPTAPPVASGRILLAEDDAQVRRLSERALATAGYLVESAVDGPSALAILARSPDRFDLLLTDLVMPGMTGHELANEVTRLAPGIRILLMSGYTDDDATRLGLRDQARAFLAKPFTPAELVARVGELLESGSSGRAFPGPDATG